MNLFATALDNDKIPNEPVDSLKCIINSKTVALAKQELNIQFKTHGLNEVSFFARIHSKYILRLIDLGKQ
jgi:hypothetical protein